MGVVNSESTTPSKAEYLERSIWTLQYYFEDLLKDDQDAAILFLQWAIGKFGKEMLDTPRRQPSVAA